MNWFLFWLFLHITAAVIAFGPIFVFPLIGTMAARSPQHGGFAIELNERIEMRLVLPLASTMLISGAGLIWTANINFFRTPYLIVAVVLYLAAMGIATGVQLPTTRKMLGLVESGDPAALVQLPPLVSRAQRFGVALTVLFLVIIFLMIIQPGGITPR